MKTPLRLSEAQANDTERAPHRFTPRGRERHEFILAAATRIFAQFGRAAITTSNLAVALRIWPSTFRRHFADMDELLGVILTRHLDAIASALAAVPPDSADMPKAHRAAYFACTHTPPGALTDEHLLLKRDRWHLPPEIREGIEATIAGLAPTLAGPNAKYTVQICALLDSTGFTAETVEAMIVSLTTGNPPAARPNFRAPAAPPSAPMHPVPGSTSIH